MPRMPSDPRDYKLDISSLGSSDQTPTREARPYLSVMFKCCSVYQRIYRNNDATAYEGRCPRCMRPVRFVVGQGGSNDRFFVVE
jgi:hypothetical protein